MIQCLKCKNVSLQPYPRHAAIGLGRCTKEVFATFYSIDKKRECADYEQANDEILQKRMIWNEKRIVSR